MIAFAAGRRRLCAFRRLFDQVKCQQKPAFDCAATMVPSINRRVDLIASSRLQRVEEPSATNPQPPISTADATTESGHKPRSETTTLQINQTSNLCPIRFRKLECRSRPTGNSLFPVMLLANVWNAA